MSRRGTAAALVIDPVSSINAQIGRFLARTEEQRLEMFRLHLQQTIRFASPVLLDLLSHDGLNLGYALELIYPPEQWPWRPLKDYTSTWLRQALSGGRPHTFLAVRDFARRYRNPGVVIRWPDNPRGRLAVRPARDLIGFQAEVAGCEISSFGRITLLKLPHRFPETVMLAMVDRMVEEIVDHPIFVGREYRVRRVLTDLSDGLPVLIFRAAPVPYCMPWATCPDGDRS